MNAYVTGMSFNLRFGDEADRCAVCLYGDSAHEAVQYEMEASGAEHPRHADLAENKMWRISFSFPLRTYEEVSRLSDQVVNLLVGAGWKLAPAIDGLPDTGSSVDGLVDTRDFQFAGTPASSFPEEPSVSGFNAADGFTLLVEKEGTKPVFSAEEIASIQDLVHQAMQVVFGQVLLPFGGSKGTWSTQTLNLLLLYLEMKHQVIERDLHGNQALQVSGRRGMIGCFIRHFHANAHPTRSGVGKEETARILAGATSLYQYSLQREDGVEITSDELLQKITGSPTEW